MSILVNIQNEREEKIVFAFLDSLAIPYTKDAEGTDQALHDFVLNYNKDLDQADAEIEEGNFVDHKDVEILFENKRRAI